MKKIKKWLFERIVIIYIYDYLTNNPFNVLGRNDVQKKTTVVSTNQFRQLGGSILPEAEPSMFSHNAVRARRFHCTISLRQLIEHSCKERVCYIEISHSFFVHR